MFAFISTVPLFRPHPLHFSRSHIVTHVSCVARSLPTYSAGAMHVNDVDFASRFYIFHHELLAEWTCQTGE